MESFSNSRDEKDVIRHAQAMYLIQKVLFFGEDMQFQGTCQTKEEDMISDKEEGMFSDEEEDMKQEPNQSVNKDTLVDAKESPHQDGLHQAGASKEATFEAITIREDSWALQAK